MKNYMEEMAEAAESRTCTALSGVCLAVGLYGMAAEVPAAEAAAYGAVALSGLPIVYSALKKLLLKRRISSSLLISMAMVACIAIGEVFAAGEVAFIMALGEKLEDATVAKARKGMASLVGLLPRVARLLSGAGVKEIPAEAVQAGDVLRVLPGEAIPADGVVQEGRSAVNQAPITGESLPMEKTVGDTVFAGTLNEHGCLDIRATRPAADTTLQQLIRLVQEADERKAPLQKTVDRWATWLVPAALVLAVAVYFLTGDTVRAVTVLVVFCPCALALATPTSVIAAIGQATRHGVLIKSGEALERMAHITCFAMDKTGTLTRGELSVSDVIPLSEEISAEQLLACAAAVESRSEHPLAKAILRRAQEEGLPLPEVAEFRMVPGIGAEGKVAGSRIFCGRPSEGEAEASLRSLRYAGKATVVVKREGVPIGVIALTDTLRPSAREMVRCLQSAGCRLMLLTGDHAAAAHTMAEQAGIAEVHAALLPAEKLAAIAAAESQGTPVCMVGDGINDAPALRQAHLGIALGGMSSELARGAADITLLAEDLRSIPYIKRLADATLRTIRLNLTLSMLINLAAIVLSVMGVLGPVSGALVHNAGSFLVILNAAMLYERKI